MFVGVMIHPTSQIKKEFQSQNGTKTHAFPTCVSSWTARYCSFHTATFVASSFLKALSFFSSGLQNVLMEFMEELNLDSLASS